MPRIPRVDQTAFTAHGGSGNSTMTALFQTMAQRPALARDAMQLVETAMRSGTVEVQLKELLAIRVSQVNNCFY